MLDDMIDWENGNNGLPFLSCTFDQFHHVSDGTTVNVLVHMRHAGRWWIDHYTKQARANVFNDGAYEHLHVHKTIHDVCPQSAQCMPKLCMISIP